MDATEMQRKYIAHFISREETLSERDAREYLAYLSENMDAAFRERRIAQLERYIRNLQREKETEKAREEEWMTKAREICATKERWEALGAAWEERHDCGVGVTTWKFRGETIMRRWTGASLDEELALVRDGDDKLTKLIEQEAA
ncbi:hypothetical protein [Brevibacillus daliensis]|uniref:hypothetical protein n=1 Tax=Brevibacillus daliensis TaxID=2892995 RepID=UPI001E3E0BA6|nr:hypothetical protein [Brevibacillus daliensis]